MGRQHAPGRGRNRMFAGIGLALAPLLALAGAEVVRAQTLADDKAALLALYNATGGANWTNKTGWSDPDNVAVGEWHGVTVTNNRVSDLFLGFNNLTGSIPADVGNLTALTSLDLGYNGLTGGIPSALGSLTRLQNLNLNDNGLNGSIPAETIGKMAALVSIDLSYNGLTGEIPSTLDQLTQLQQLRLQGNRLRGRIPSALGTLTRLTYVDLSGNELRGAIPDLGNLPSLTVLNLSINQLSGSIPASLGNLTQLQELSLVTNQLTGPIPASLGNLTQLRQLGLAANQLSGSIPGALGSLMSLTELALFENQLSGPIPPEFGNLASLQYLRLENNQLTGPLPPQLGNLTGLLRLHLFNNQLTGAIPSEWGGLGSLKWLILGANRDLEGNIPSTFAQLSALQELWLGATSVNCDPLAYDPPDQTLRDFLDALGDEFRCFAPPAPSPPPRPRAYVSITDASAPEGEAVTFTVTRSGARGGAVSVQWVTAPDEREGATAAGASDYTAVTEKQTLDFAAGETEKTISVQTANDDLDEPAETFLVRLSDASGTSVRVSIRDGEAVGTITDEDLPPALSIADAAPVTEGGTAVFTVRLSAVSGQTVTVAWNTASGTATEDADYVGGGDGRDRGRGNERDDLGRDDRR